MLVNEKWTAEWHPVQATDEQGGFVRQTSGFRHWVTTDGSPGITGSCGFIAEADPVIPWQEGKSAAERLDALGVPVTSHFEDGIPHTLSQQGVELAQTFIARRLAE